MAKSFHDLPAELVENILEELNLKDKCALRLTSHPICVKIDDSTFKQHFRSKRVYVTAGSLVEFTELTAESSLVCLLESLTLVGIARSKTDGETASQEYVDICARLLGQALDNILARDPARGLESLSLEVVMQIGGKLVSTNKGLGGSMTRPCKLRSARTVWEAIAQTFRIAMLGLEKSRMPLRELHVFSKVERCALACDDLGRLLRYSLEPSLKGVRKLSMVLSQRLPERGLGSARTASELVMKDSFGSTDGYKGKSPLREAAEDSSVLHSLSNHQNDEENSETLGWAQYPMTVPRINDEDGGTLNILQWLQKFPSLESLDIKWFNIQQPAITDQPINLFSDRTNRPVLHPNLKSIWLINLCLPLGPLKEFFNAHRGIEKATFHYIRIGPPDIQEALDWYREINERLDRLYLYNCYVWEDTHSLPRRRYIRKNGVEFFTSLQQDLDDYYDADEERRLIGPPWRID